MIFNFWKCDANESLAEITDSPCVLPMICLVLRMGQQSHWNFKKKFKSTFG